MSERDAEHGARVPHDELPRKRTVPPEEQPVPRLWEHDAYEAIERTYLEVDGDGE